jgi:hypothetical protein
MYKQSLSISYFISIKLGFQENYAPVKNKKSTLLENAVFVGLYRLSNVPTRFPRPHLASHR